MSDAARLDPRNVRRRFDRAAASFDSADFVHAVTRNGLLARLEPLVVEADLVLDLGAATGAANAPLRKRFKGAYVVSLDFSAAMLRQNLRQQRLFSRRPCVQADARQLPFTEQGFDVVFANQLLPWIDDPGPVLDEVARVLRKDGVFAFASLGPDSLRELRDAWAAVDGHPHVNRFPDMHDVGDALVRAGLRDPVLDVDRLTVRYEDASRLFADLTRMGARNALHGRNRSLVGKGRFDDMIRALRGASGSGEIRFDLELVYGHCWGGGRRDPADYRIDASTIARRQR